MAGLRRHRRVTGWFAALALLGNMLAMAFVGPSAAVTRVDDLLGTVVICTADGAKVLPGEGPDHSRAQHCPACTLLAPVALAVAIAFITIDFPPALSTRPTILQPRAPAVHVSLGGIRSRAPPLSV